MATFTSASYEGRYLQLNITETVNVAANTSTLNWTLSSIGGQVSYYTIDTTKVTINGTVVYSVGRTAWDSHAFPAAKGSVSGSITVSHASNGTGTVSVGFSTRVYYAGAQEFGGTMTLTTIDRTAPTVSCSVGSITANGFKISASSSATADIWQYSTNGGTNWTQFSTTAGTSASVTLSSLAPNTTYSVKVRARKKSNQVYGTSSAVSTKTLGGSVINSVSAVTADAGTVTISLNVTVYNSSYVHTLILKNGSVTVLTFNNLSWGVGTANKTITLTAAQRTTLLNSMPNAKSFTGTFSLKTMSGSSQIGSLSEKTATISTTANSSPTMGTFTFRDSNTVTAAVTGNNQYFIQNQSYLEVAPAIATAKNGASIVKYSATCNGATSSNTNGASISLGKVAKSGNITVTVTATDSRGYTVSQSKTIPVLAYEKPKIAALTVRRTNNIEAEMQLVFNGNISSIKIGDAEKNTVKNVKYCVKKTSDSAWQSPVNITVSKTGLNFSFSNLSLVSLDANFSWDFYLRISDNLTDLNLEYVIPQGTPLVALRKQKVGINTPNPQATLDVGGNMRVNGSLLTDFVIQQGTSGIWTYRKWKSGIAECWGRKSVSTTISNNWGNLFTSGALSALNVTFPFTFAAVPTITANLSCNGAGAILMVPGSSPGPSVNSTGVYELARGNDMSSARTFWVNFYVIGKV